MNSKKQILCAQKSFKNNGASAGVWLMRKGSKKKGKKKGKGDVPLSREALIRRANGARELLPSSVVPPAALTYACGPAETAGFLTISLDTSPRAMPAPAKQAVFGLFETNMRSMYEENAAWDPEEKRAELFAPTSRILLVHAADGELVAFSHFRFEADDDGSYFNKKLAAIFLVVSLLLRKHCSCLTPPPPPHTHTLANDRRPKARGALRVRTPSRIALSAAGPWRASHEDFGARGPALSDAKAHAHGVQEQLRRHGILQFEAALRDR